TGCGRMPAKADRGLFSNLACPRTTRAAVPMLRLDVRRDVTRHGNWLINCIGNDGRPWKLPTETFKLSSLEFRCQMKRGCLFDVRSFDEMDPSRLGKPATASDQVFNQRPSGR